MPQSPLESHIPSFLDKVLDECPCNDDIVMLGDFNLNQLEITASTKTMDNICMVHGLHQLIDQPTRVTDTTSTLIDLIFVSELSFIVSLGVVPIGISDHFGTFLSRSAHKPNHSKHEHLLHNYRDFKAFNEEKCLEDINAAPWESVDIFDDIDNKVDIFYQLITQLLDWHKRK